MQIQQDIALRKYNTFGMDVTAKYFAEITTFEELQLVLEHKNFPNKLILGGGSNMLLTKDVEALVLHINIKGITVVQETKNEVLVAANAGENWHEFVLWTLDKNYAGLENLSLIPGNVGTAPIQNIGAYGVELKDVFFSCEALAIDTLEKRTFKKEDCNFGYRDSVFKKQLKGKYIITRVTFCLQKKQFKLHTNYGAIKEELAKIKVTNPTPKDVSNAVIAIRERKLPNPKKIGNSGSFFKNPVITTEHIEQLKTNFPEMPYYTISSKQVKVPAGWLIEKAGFKGKRFNNYGVHQEQALVLVNYGNAKGTDILKLAELIKKTIQRLFAIELEAEVNIL